LIIFWYYSQISLDCAVCAIELAGPSKESSWDDRETEVRWVAMNSDVVKQPTNAEMLVVKTLEPVNEPSYEILSGSAKCIQVLLNAIVAFSKYSCSVKEINFKDTLMLQVGNYNYALYHLSWIQILKLMIIMQYNIYI